MAHVNVVAAGRVQSWIRKTIKQKILVSTWDQFSNRFEYNQPVPKAGENKVPNSVIHKVSDDLKMGQYSVTLLAIRRTGAAVIGGANSAEGKESKPTTKIVSVYFTNQRVPKSLPDMSVMGGLGEFYGIAEATIDMVGDDFVEQTDYDHQKAMVEGADEFLTSAAAWESSEYGSEINHPVDTVLHPNIYAWINGAVVKNTWSSTYATSVTNLETATDTEMDSGDGLTIAAMDAIHLKAARTIVPIGGMGGGKANNEVQWVLKISDAQWYDLTTDTTASVGWRDLFKYTESGFDRLFNGYVGVYKNMMVVVDPRAPLFDNTSGTLTIQYITPLADNRVRRAKGSSDGTMECAMLMGRGAIGLADMMEMDLVRKSRDYEFVKSICGHRKRGTMRLDLDATVAATSARVNESSFLFLTATLAASV